MGSASSAVPKISETLTPLPVRLLDYLYHSFIFYFFFFLRKWELIVSSVYFQSFLLRVLKCGN